MLPTSDADTLPASLHTSYPGRTLVLVFTSPELTDLPEKNIPCMHDALLMSVPWPLLHLQSCDSGYVANTDNALLKFKFAHLNSVDFHIKVSNRAGQLVRKEASRNKPPIV
jgi:hypothetical protein